MELPLEEFQNQFNLSTKCKTSGKISGYEILKKSDDCNYVIKIKINDIVYYTDIFHNNKNCSVENNKKILEILYPKGKEIEVIVNAEQDYIFLADKNTEYIKYDSNSIGFCTNNNVIEELQNQPEKIPENNSNYYLSGGLILSFIIIGVLVFKLLKFKK